MMENCINTRILKKLKVYGIGQRKLDDDILNEKPPTRFAVYDIDDENLCHDVMETVCNIPGCKFSAECLLEFEDHYNSSHRYSCAQCKKILPSPHFLDLHLQENHDSFFAVMAEKRPSYCCFIEDCKEKFMTVNERHDHCIKIHKLPKDFRFERKDTHKKKGNEHSKLHMDVDYTKKTKNKLMFSNNKQKTFLKYTGKKFTQDNENKSEKGNKMDISVDELKQNLPN